MTIYLGTDHGGFELKEAIKQWLQEQTYQIEDCGAYELNKDDDYPDFAFAVAEKVANNSESVGILFCRSGGGMTIAANKITGIRAVDVFDLTSAIHAKTHNNANIISLGADWMNVEESKLIIENFLKTPFEGEERHIRRLEKIEEREK